LIEAVRGVVRADEIIQIRVLERVGLEGKVLVRAQVVDPELFGPSRLAGGLLLEEEDIRLNTCA
jgi:hypothetical protein